MNALMAASEAKVVPLAVSSVQDIPLENIRGSMRRSEPVGKTQPMF